MCTCGDLRTDCDEVFRKRTDEPDLPFEERCMRHFVFGAKRVMTDWGYDKAGLWADPENGPLSLGGERVIRATIECKVRRRGSFFRSSMGCRTSTHRPLPPPAGFSGRVAVPVRRERMKTYMSSR